MDLNFKFSCLKYLMMRNLKQLCFTFELHYFDQQKLVVIMQYSLYQSYWALKLLLLYQLSVSLSLHYCSFNYLINYYLQDLLSMCCCLRMEWYQMDLSRYHYYLEQMMYYQSIELQLTVQIRVKFNFRIKYLLLKLGQQFVDLFIMLLCLRLVY